MAVRQDADNLAWDLSDELFDKATNHVQLSSTCREIESFAKKIFGRPVTLTTPLIIGGFNALYPFRVEGMCDGVLVRIPCPDQAEFPEEKTLAEAATAKCISNFAGCPVPKILHYGVDSDIGAFIIMRDIGTRRPLTQALERHCEDLNETPVLNPDIPESKLEELYAKIAQCLLQLAGMTFPRIGALVETSAESYRAMGRPLTLNMSNMVQQSNVPSFIFPPKGTTYQTADEWYVVLAEMQIATLLFQHNDMVSSDDDCRNKYVARQLFRRLAKQGRISSFGFADDDWSAQSRHTPAKLPMLDSSSSFRLWSDDLRPSNVIVDEDDQILGIIDWEFAYVGPTQFSLDPPWWLLLEVPEMWDEGIENWASNYEKRLKTWLSAMREVEKGMRPSSALIFSAYMQESWETGRFWLNYAVRKSWAFDVIYWKYLDGRFFGERAKDIPEDELWKARVHLLTEEERTAMEPLVETKMEESRDRVLVHWEAGEARQRLSNFLFE